MKLFSFGPDVAETTEESQSAVSAATSDGREGDVDAVRAKRREKKRKANARKLEKKHASSGSVAPPQPARDHAKRRVDTTPTPAWADKAKTAVLRDAGTGSDSDTSSDDSSGDEPTPAPPPVPAAKTYFDPFTKRRVVLGGGSAAAVGDRQPASPAPDTSCAAAVAVVPKEHPKTNNETQRGAIKSHAGPEHEADEVAAFYRIEAARQSAPASKAPEREKRGNAQRLSARAAGTIDRAAINAKRATKLASSSESSDSSDSEMDRKKEGQAVSGGSESKGSAVHGIQASQQKKRTSNKGDDAALDDIFRDAVNVAANPSARKERAAGKLLNEATRTVEIKNALAMESESDDDRPSFVPASMLESRKQVVKPTPTETTRTPYQNTTICSNRCHLRSKLQRPDKAKMLDPLRSQATLDANGMDTDDGSKSSDSSTDACSRAKVLIAKGRESPTASVDKPGKVARTVSAASRSCSADKASSSSSSSSTSSSLSEDEAPENPAGPAHAVKSFYDPFTKRRIVIGGASSGSSVSPPRQDANGSAAKKKTPTVAATAATAHAGTGAGEPPVSGDAAAAGQQATSKKRKASVHDFSKHVANDDTAAAASRDSTGTDQQPQRISKPAGTVPGGRRKEELVSSSSSSSSDSASSDTDEEEMQPPAQASNSAPRQPTAPKSYYDPFSKKRVMVSGGQGGSDDGEAAEAKREGKSSEVRTKADKQRASVAKESSSSSSESSSSEDEEAEGKAEVNAGVAKGRAVGARTLYDPFAKKRIVVQPAWEAPPGRADTDSDEFRSASKRQRVDGDNQAASSVAAAWDVPLPKKRGGKPRPDLGNAVAPRESAESAPESESDAQRNGGGNGMGAFDTPLPRKRGGKARPDLAHPPSLPAPASASAARTAAGSPDDGRGGGDAAEAGACAAIVTAAAGQPGPGEAGTARDRAVKHILFVGQLPYEATVPMVQAHFAACAPGENIKVRLLTEKNTGKPRGIAFVEVPNAEAGMRALALDYSLLGSRRIRVEPTAKGSGNSDKRKEAILALKVEHAASQRDQVTGAVDAALPRDGDSAKIQRGDVDAGVMDFLCSIPMSLVEQAVGEAAALEVGSIRNKSAYLMGFLKAKVAHLQSGAPAQSTTARGEGHVGGGAGRGSSEAKPSNKPSGRPAGGAVGGDATATAAAAAPQDKIDFFSTEPLKRKRGGKARPDLARACEEGGSEGSASLPPPPQASQEPSAVAGKTDFNTPLPRKRGGRRAAQSSQ